MKNCDNCSHGSYGLDCETGVETLYCREDEYEHDVEPDNVCGEHQFIEGYENNENTVIYEEPNNVIKEDQAGVKVLVKTK